MKIQKKLTLGSVLLGVVPVVFAAVTIGWIANNSAEEALRNQAQAQLVSIRDTSKNQIEDYYGTIRNQVLTFSNDRMIIQAAKEFRRAFSSYRSEAGLADGDIAQMRGSLSSYYTGDYSSEYARRNGGDSAGAGSLVSALDADAVALQHTYIKNNPNPLGSKDALSDPGDGSRYAATHRTYHPHIRDYLSKFGYYDIFIADPNTGDIVYSVYKELDYATSLMDGPYAGTGIGQAFQQANRANSQSAVALTDFAPYKPSYMDQAGFIASPIYDGNEKVGVLIFQMPIDKINNIMTHHARWSQAGLGASGETYLVGSDYKMRSESRFLIEDKAGYLDAVRKAGLNSQAAELIDSKESAIGLGEVRTDGTRAALGGKTGFEIFPDYRDVPVLSAYAPLDIPGINWVIMSEIDEAEAFAPVYALAKKITGTAITVSLVIFGIAVFIGWGFARSITAPLTRSVKAMHQIADGDLNQRLKVVGDDELAEFASSYNHFAERLSEIISQVKLGAETVSSGSVEINEGNVDLSQRTEEQAAALEETASSMEEMTSNVKQSADNAIKANELAVGARDQAEQGGAVVEKAVVAMGEINESSTKIAEIIGMINEISFQTNLLALNAAVEAARAGEQGRGFAVVASEVRNLAQRSGNAADEIKKLIEDSVARVQNGSQLVAETGKSLTEIQDSVTRVTDIVSEMNAAGQEQSTGIEQVNRAVMQMDEVVQQNAALVEEGAATSDNLAEEAQKLSELMTFFKLDGNGGTQQARPQTRPIASSRTAGAKQQPGFVSKPRRRVKAKASVEAGAPATEAESADMPTMSERDAKMEDF